MPGLAPGISGLRGARYLPSHGSAKPRTRVDSACPSRTFRRRWVSLRPAGTGRCIEPLQVDHEFVAMLRMICQSAVRQATHQDTACIDSRSWPAGAGPSTPDRSCFHTAAVQLAQPKYIDSTFMVAVSATGRKRPRRAVVGGGNDQPDYSTFTICCPGNTYRARSTSDSVPSPIDSTDPELREDQASAQLLTSASSRSARSGDSTGISAAFVSSRSSDRSCGRAIAAQPQQI